MRIFLTGGTGFIGSHFINEAHKRGLEIIALRRAGSCPRVKLEKQPTWIDGQLDDDHTLTLSNVDILVHLASHTANPPYDELSTCLYWNVYASLKLAEQAKKCGVEKYLIAGSCFEYGKSADDYDLIPEDAPLLPNLSYPISKAAASVAFIGFASENHLKLQILRLFQVYGEGEQESRFWPSLKAAALCGKNFPMSPGEQVRDFIHVSEVANQLANALDFYGVEAGSPHIRNVGTGSPKTLRSFAEYWWKEWGGVGELVFGQIPYRNNEVMRLVPRIDGVGPRK